MVKSGLHSVGTGSLWLSLLTFGIYFLNVLVGGPLGRKPWLSDVAEMLTLFVAVIFFVAGTIAREYEDRPSAKRADKGR
jgi:hypothetical protein